MAQAHPGLDSTKFVSQTVHRIFDEHYVQPTIRELQEAQIELLTANPVEQLVHEDLEAQLRQLLIKLLQRAQVESFTA